MPAIRRPRLTREESQRQTRQHLLASAASIIADQGMTAATVRVIAEAAGYSQGAFYSNFADKDALLADLMEETLRTRAHELEQLTASLSCTDLEQTISALVRCMVDTHQDRETSTLLLELQLHAMHFPDFAKRVAPHRRAFLERFTACVVDLATRHGIELPLSAQETALSLMALWNGFSVQASGLHAVQPDDIYRTVIRRLLLQTPAQH